MGALELGDRTTRWVTPHAAAFGAWLTYAAAWSITGRAMGASPDSADNAFGFVFEVGWPGLVASGLGAGLLALLRRPGVDA